MIEDIKLIKSDAEVAIEAILEKLETKGIKVYRMQLFTSRNRSPQVNIVVDEQGGSR